MDRSKINTVFENTVGSPLSSLSPLGGGSISSAYKAVLKNGDSYFVKIDPQYDDMFITEAHGLAELGRSSALRIPQTVHADNDVLILELLPVAPMSDRNTFFEEFGRRFALMHRTTDTTFGFYEDNYIGSTPQQNTSRHSSWKEFYLIHRLTFQFMLAEQHGYVDSRLSSGFRTLESCLDKILPDDGEPPALLHGDLWSGNYLCLQRNIPAIIDPAVYYGHREADLGMTLLFGGFSERFYEAYNEEYPLQNGWEDRMAMYKLYHLFNHLNLFGSGYYAQVAGTIDFLVRKYA